MTPESIRTGWQRWWPFACLCLLGAARGIVLDAVPTVGSSLLSLSVGTGSAALVVLTWWTIVRARTISLNAAMASACAGAMLFAGPFLPTLLGVRGIDANSIVLALTLTAVVVAVARPAFRTTDGAEVAGRLWPGIAAIAGLLLLLPIPSFASTSAVMTIAMMPMLTGVGAAWFRSVRAPKLLRALCALTATAAVFTAAGLARHAMHVTAGHGPWLAACLDGLETLFSVLALLRLGGTRWSAQFVLVPATIIVVALASVRSWPDARTVAGVAVLAISAVFLLLPPSPAVAESAELGILP